MCNSKRKGTTGIQTDSQLSNLRRGPNKMNPSDSEDSGETMMSVRRTGGHHVFNHQTWGNWVTGAIYSQSTSIKSYALVFSRCPTHKW